MSLPKLYRAALLSICLPMPTVWSQASAQEHVPDQGLIVKESSPDWLAGRDLPSDARTDLSHVQDGTDYLLTDWQVRANDQGYDSYYRFASRIVDRSGLEEGGKITIQFDPRIETAALNFVHIIRDGKVIDRTADVKFTVVEREDDLDEGIISGSLEALTNLKDVRVGDIVDFAVTRHVRSSLWPGHYFASFGDRYSQPLSYRAVRFLWPADRPLRFTTVNSTIKFTERAAGTLREWEWIARDWPVQESEDDVPSWYPQYGRVDISTMSSWGEVAHWANGLYAVDTTLPDAFARQLDEIAARSSSAADRLTEALRLVQDTIRYVGEEIGEGSYVPRSPATVIERGYGDCKDKSLLLAVALKRLGIEAAPALVSTRPGFDLPERQPSPLMFDHVIVRAELDGQVLWLDPTMTHQGGRGLAIVPSDLGYALPIRPGQDGLEEMKGYGTHAGTMDVLEQFSVDEEGQTPLTLHVETIYTDSLADWFRSRVASTGTAGIGRENLTYYQNRFSGLAESQPVEITDDLDANRLTMVENYTLTKGAFDADKTASDFKVYGYAVQDLMPRKQPGERKQPLELPPFASRNQVIEVRAKDRIPWIPDPIAVDTGGTHFSRKSTYEDGLLRITYALRSDGLRMVPAADTGAYYDLAETIADESSLSFYLDKSPRPSQASNNGIDPALLAPVRDDIAKVGALMTKNDQPSLIEALSIINRVSEKVERPSPLAGLVDGLKGLLLTGLNRSVPAKAALLSSVAQYQGNAQIIRILIAHQLDGNDPDALMDSMVIALKAQPSVLTSMPLNWVQTAQRQIGRLPEEARQKKSSRLCLILAKADWQLDPRAIEGESMLECAVQAELLAGRLEEAQVLLHKKPGAGALARLAVDKRFEAIWPDIDRSVSSGFREQIDAEVAEARNAAEQAPEDFNAAFRLIRALRVAGKPQDAVAAGKALADRSDLIEAIGEPAFWFVNEYAYALSAAGNVDDAISRMDSLIALGVDSYPNLISQIINRAEILSEWGLSERAVAAFDEAETKFGNFASPFGKMWIWAGKSCTLRDLKRFDDANEIDSKIAEHREDNKSAFVMAAACRNDQSAIEQMILTRMDDPDERNDMLRGFVRFTGPEASSPLSRRLRKVMDAVYAQPALQAQLKRYGRPITFAGARAYWGAF